MLGLGLSVQGSCYLPKLGPFRNLAKDERGYSEFIDVLINGDGNGQLGHEGLGFRCCRGVGV